MAVATWIESVDESAVRGTPEVKLLVQREVVDRIAASLPSAGFFHIADDDYRERPDDKRRNAIELVFSGDLVCEGEAICYPSPSRSQVVAGRRVLELPLLVESLAARHRTVDRVVLRDLMDVGLVDFSWPAKFSPPLSDRLLFLLNDPHG